MLTHLEALIQALATRGVADICVHAFLDGRDTPPRSGLGYVRELEAALARMGVGRIATVTGRYYAMDRDQRWERWSGLTTPWSWERDCRRIGGTGRDRGLRKWRKRRVRPAQVILRDGAPSGLVRDGTRCCFLIFGRTGPEN